MIKQYFKQLGDIFKSAFCFLKETFKSYGLIILLLVVLQLGIIIPLLYFSKEIGFLNFSPVYKIVSILGLILYFTLFYVMFKKVFNLACLGLKKEKITTLRFIKSLLILAIFNCIPFFALVILYNLSLVIPDYGKILKIILSVFTFVFYLSMSLSIGAISKWQNKNIIISIFKGVKTFFKKIHFCAPVFLIVFGLATLISYLTCVILYAILIYLNCINENIINTIHAFANVYSLYAICGFYIGLQVTVLKNEEE